MVSSSIIANNTYYNWGVSGELENYGGGVSVFLQSKLQPKLIFDLEGSWTLVQDGTGIYSYNYYTDQYVLLNTQNLSFAKCVSDIAIFPWANSMHESFNLGFFLGGGPVWSLNTQEHIGFIERWKAVETVQSFYSRGGIQANIKSSAVRVYRIRLGYDQVKFDSIIDYRNDYKGLFMQFGLEFQF